MLTPSVSNTVVNLIIVSVLLTHGAAHDPTTTSQSASLIDIKNTLKVRHSEGPLIMPTDLDAATAARKREAQAQVQKQTVVTVMLVCLIILLGVLVLVF